MRSVFEYEAFEDYERETDLEWWQSERHPELCLLVRPGSSDIKSAREVIDNHAYLRPRLGFTIKPGSHWLDLGASIGDFALLADSCGASVTCFEADPDHFRLLEDNTADASSVQCHHAAVLPPPYEDHDTTWLHTRTGEHAWRNSIAHRWPDSITIEVPAVTINEALARCASPPTGIKIDVEGSEMPILEQWTVPDYVTHLVFKWSFDVDPNIARLRAVLETLRPRFRHLNYHSRVDSSWPQWKWFPSAVTVFAWN